MNKTCPTCKEPVFDDDVFCPNCGTNLQVTARPEPRAISRRRPAKKPPQLRNLAIIAAICLLTAVIILAVILLFGGKPKPEDSVTDFCEAMQDWNWDKLNKLGWPEEIPLPGDGTHPASGSLEKYMEKCAEEITWELESQNVQGSSAVLTVSFTFQDAAPVVSAAMEEYALAAASLELLDADEALLAETFEKLLKEAGKKQELETSTLDVTFTCTKTGGEWVISDISEEAEQVLSANLLSVFAGRGDDLSPETLWQDVKMGETASLSGMTLWVKACAATESLTDGTRTVNAAVGKKFVIFTLELQSSGEEALTLQTDAWTLTDAEGQEFLPYGDAHMYVADVLQGKTLSPETPLTGTVIYSVPQETSGYAIRLLDTVAAKGFRLYADETENPGGGGEPGGTEEAVRQPLNVIGYVNVKSDRLVVRSGPGTQYDKLDALDAGDKVILLDIQQVGDVAWGRIEGGWVCMDYITFRKPADKD